MNPTLYNITFTAAFILFCLMGIFFIMLIVQDIKARRQLKELDRNIYNPSRRGRKTKWIEPKVRNHHQKDDKETEKQQILDAKSLIHGKHEGKIVIENFKPQMTGGINKVIDETYKDTKKFKDDINGEITE